MNLAPTGGWGVGMWWCWSKNLWCIIIHLVYLGLLTSKCIIIHLVYLGLLNNNLPCVSWSAYFQVLSPSNNSIHTSSAHGVWCILTFRYQLSGVSKLFQRSLLLIITITCSKSVLWKMLPPTVSAKFLMFWFPTLWFNLIVAPGWRQDYVPHIYKYWTSL